MKTFILNNLFIIQLLGWPVFGQHLELKAGAYDFTDNAAREFYTFAPTVMVGSEVWQISRICLNISTGIAYHSFRYAEDRHVLMMIPVFLRMNYHIPNPDAKVWPVVGLGLSLMAKSDKNVTFSKTKYSLAYGYHTYAALKWHIKPLWVMSVELTYNLMMPPSMEEINISGFIPAIGIEIPL